MVDIDNILEATKNRIKLQAEEVLKNVAGSAKVKLPELTIQKFESTGKGFG